MMSVSVLLSSRLKIDDCGRGQPLNRADYLNQAQWPPMSGRDSSRARDKVILIPQDVAMLWRTFAWWTTTPGPKPQACAQP